MTGGSMLTETPEERQERLARLAADALLALSPLFATLAASFLAGVALFALPIVVLTAITTLGAILALPGAIGPGSGARSSTVPQPDAAGALEVALSVAAFGLTGMLAGMLRRARVRRAGLHTGAAGELSALPELLVMFVCFVVIEAAHVVLEPRLLALFRSSPSTVGILLAVLLVLAWGGHRLWRWLADTLLWQLTPDQARQAAAAIVQAERRRSTGDA
jgi:hypothetical protein